MNVLGLAVSRRVRIGSGLMLVAGSLSVAAGIAATPASALSAATACSGHYTVKNVKPTEKNAPAGDWTSEASHLTAQGISCAKAKGVAGEYTRETCGYCKTVHKVGPYAIKVNSNDTVVTATKGSILIRFHFSTIPNESPF